MEEIKITTENMEEISKIEKENTKSSTDYKIIVDMIKEVDEQYRTMSQTLSEMVQESYGLKPDVLEMILPYTKDQIPTMDSNEIREFLEKYRIDKSDERFINMTNEELIEAMNVIKDASLVLLSTKVEADEIKASSNDVLKEYFNYMSSDKVRKSREKRLESMKKALELETNEVEKNKIKRMITTMEEALNFSFIKSRFEKFGEKEIKSIMDSYFDMTRGSYIISRYTEKIVKFGYNADIYKYFFNIEENFLAKKYSPFNNLFLFIYMRTVAYSDPYNQSDKMFVQSLTGAIANLIYHKFDNLESEQFFIHVITDVLDIFEKNTDYFKENNTTYEEHPARKEVEAEHEKKRKNSLINMLRNMNINNFDESMSADELQELYNKETELMIKKQIGSSKNNEELEIEDSENVEITEDGEVSITPTIKKEELSSVYGTVLNPDGTITEEVNSDELDNENEKSEVKKIIDSL